jgi:shikimate dehydrogenase
VSGVARPDRYAVVGHPVAHSRSPSIHAEFARATGQSLEYGRMDVRPERFATDVRAFFAGGGRGLNVTVPHKEAAFTLVDATTERAARAGAVNTIAVRADGSLLGDNTDGAGLVTDLERNLGVTLARRRILILGAGGATRGVLGPLLARGPASIAIANRTPGRATALATTFADLGNVVGGAYGEVDGGRWDLLINATSASLAGEVPPLAAGAVDGATVCYDMAYAQDDTAFTRLARDRGAGEAHMGWGMLVEQAAEAFLVWRGVRPVTGAILARLRAGG